MMPCQRCYGRPTIIHSPGFVLIFLVSCFCFSHVFSHFLSDFRSLNFSLTFSLSLSLSISLTTHLSFSLLIAFSLTLFRFLSVCAYSLCFIVCIYYVLFRTKNNWKIIVKSHLSFSHIHVHFLTPFLCLALTLSLSLSRSLSLYLHMSLSLSFLFCLSLLYVALDCIAPINTHLTLCSLYFQALFKRIGSGQLNSYISFAYVEDFQK